MSDMKRLSFETERELSPWEIAEREATDYKNSYQYQDEDFIELMEKANGIPFVMQVW